ncbi:MAG: hypothetical protein AB7V56_06395 [Candidatus Nitrosocosmicus sp.]
MTRRYNNNIPLKKIILDQKKEDSLRELCVMENYYFDKNQILKPRVQFICGNLTCQQLDITANFSPNHYTSSTGPSQLGGVYITTIFEEPKLRCNKCLLEYFSLLPKGRNLIIHQVKEN